MQHQKLFADKRSEHLNDFSITNKILYETIVRSDIYDERNDRPL